MAFAAAGIAAHLPGVVASLTELPIIGVPLSSSFQGLDSPFSIVQVSLVPTASMAVGGAKKTAIFACQILALKYPGFGGRLRVYKREMEESFRGKQ